MKNNFLLTDGHLYKWSTKLNQFVFLRAVPSFIETLEAAIDWNYNS